MAAELDVVAAGLAPVLVGVLVEEVVPVVSTVELGVSWELVGCFSAGGSDATELMMLGSSLGSATFPLTVHPPEALGQAGALNVGL